jgi:hypothetical protein
VQVVRDRPLAAAMRAYVAATLLHVPRESEGRAYALLSHVVHSQVCSSPPPGSCT